MAKMRGFKPDIWTDDKFVSLSPLARLLFLGMFTYACDNGHLDDSATQLKMRILPAEACDVAALVDELVTVKLVVRVAPTRTRAGYLKVKNLAKHQRKPDMRWLTLCDHCPHDEDSRYKPAELAGSPSGNGADAASPPRGHSGEGDVEGEGEGEGEGEELPSSSETDDGDEEPPPGPEPDLVVEELCTHLADLIEANGSPRPKIGKKWRDACRLMRDRDGRTPEQIRAAIDWCQADEFWRSNILSMPKLRSQYNQLRLQAQRRRDGPPGQRLATSDQRLLDAAAIKRRLLDEEPHQPQIGP